MLYIDSDILQETKDGKIIYYKKDENGTCINLYIEDKKSKTIEYFMNNFITESILLDGFTKLPDFVKPIGRNFKTGRLTYYLNKFIKKEKISSLTISQKQKSSISANNLLLNVNDFEKLRRTVIDVNQESQRKLNHKLLEILNLIFPQHFQLSENILIKTSKFSLLSAIDTVNINDLTENDVTKITDFAFRASKRFKRTNISERILLDMKDKIRIQTLEDILAEYKKLLEEEPNEGKWQNFFNKYIRVFDTGYIDSISQVNISVFTTKKPDLMMLDLHNYIDLYELKTTKTHLLSYDESHNNYYWHSDIAKVIAQAEKYIKEMQDGSSNIIRAIKVQMNKDVEIIRPKTIILAGHSKQLQNEKQKQDFKMLRESLKNISFVLYDEFYDRLNNFYELLQKKK